MNSSVLLKHFNNTDVDIENILKAQDIAKSCLDYMNEYLKPGLTRDDIHEECKNYMLNLGAERFWTHDDPALILFDDLTTYSAHECPSSLFDLKKIKENDLITIDVSPTIKNGWGDLARSYIMQDGKIISYKDCNNSEIKEAIEFEYKLHELFINSINEDTTFNQLYLIIEDYVSKHNYYNCDYHGNYGHTIENNPKDRVTIAKDVNVNISKYNKPITFEPHICKIDGTYGVKHENMYVFYEGKMHEI